MMSPGKGPLSRHDKLLLVHAYVDGELDAFNTLAIKQEIDADQRLGIYTAIDYVDILKELIEDWHIAGMGDLNESGEKARDYIMALTNRLLRVAERMQNPMLEYKFSWIHG